MTVLVQKLDMLDADVVLYKKFFRSRQSEYFQKELMFKEAEWNQGSIKLFGKTLLEPRLSAYYGDYPYRYSGFSREPLSWNPILLEIKSLIESTSGVQFNAALLNFYRNGNDGIGWHSDDERDLESPVIASVSFGASRKFVFQRKEDKT